MLLHAGLRCRQQETGEAPVGLPQVWVVAHQHVAGVHAGRAVGRSLFHGRRRGRPQRQIKQRADNGAGQDLRHHQRFHPQNRDEARLSPPLISSAVTRSPRGVSFRAYLPRGRDLAPVQPYARLPRLTKRTANRPGALGGLA